MTRVIEAAKEHYRDRERVEIPVPEWDVTLYATPLTIKQRQKIRRAAGDDGLAFMVELLITKAELKDEGRAFSREDKHDLLNEVDAAIIERVADKIFSELSPKDAAKN